MGNITNEEYRKILDSGDVLANSLSVILLENLNSELSRKQLTDVVNSMTTEVKKRHNLLIDELQK